MYGTTVSLNPTYFIGMDLHSNNVVICVLQNAANQTGQLVKKVIKCKKIALSPELEELQLFLKPYCCAQHQATVESTYNWYNIADLFEDNGWHLKLADPTTVKNNKTKFSDDITNAEFLADQMRLGALKAADIIPKQDRAFRDLVRLRVDLVQDRARYRDLTELVSIFDNENTRLKAGHYLTAMHHLSLQILQLEKQIEAQEAKNYLTCHRYLPRLYSMKGCGFILGSIIATEIVNINRFRTEKDFVSYCRLSPAVRLSNDKKKGDGNRKNGNAYLSWAMTELANLMVFHNPVIKKKYDRQFKKSQVRAKAIRSIAAKLARCIWHMLKKHIDFRIDLAFK